MAGVLENGSSQESLDPQRMIDRINELPQQIRDAWRIVQEFRLPPDFVVPAGLDEILILGMGGSAIGADLAAGLVAPVAAVPIWTHRGYGLPGWADKQTLVIASSYSGATEETLSGWEEAGRRGVPRLAITTGGPLGEATDGAALVRFRYASQPRAALGYSLTLILGVLHKIGILEELTNEIETVAAYLEASCREWQPDVPVSENLPKRLATWCMGGLPVIFGADHLTAVARRWTTQLNENAKTWALWAEMPELNHNVVVGFEHPRGVAEATRVLMLLSARYDDRISLRFDVTGQLLDEAGVSWLPIVTEGESRLAELMWAVYLGDFASYYLALLYGVNPTPVGPIEQLKSQLAAR